MLTKNVEVKKVSMDISLKKEDFMIKEVYILLAKIVIAQINTKVS